MRTDQLIALAAGVVLIGATGCASRGYVNTVVDERARLVEQRVGQVERTLDDTAATTGRNSARLDEVDRTANDARELADGAMAASRQLGVTADTMSARVDGLAADNRRLLFEVIVAEDHGRFGFGDATLPPPVSAKLDDLVVRVRSLESPAHLEIEGHTDATGPASYNARLALLRAESVRRYLHERHGLPLHKISVISYGEEKPVAPNDTVEGRATNRRVVVRVLG